MMKQPVFLLLFVLLLASCGGTKSVSALKEVSSKEAISSHKAVAPNFETLAGRVQLVYETDEKLQRITVSIRMEKDKQIWIKASVLGITISKILITPTRVSYYETIGRTYFDGDFALLGAWLGTPINFQQTQNLLLGQSIFTLNPSDYEVSVFNDKFKLEPNRQPQNFIHSLFLYPDNFKVASETVSQPDNNRLLSIRYGEYQKLQGQFFPSSILVHSSEDDSSTKIEINYRKIDLNVALSFPFSIPSGYEEIQLF